MLISIYGYLLLGALFVVIYIWPATARLWRPFAISLSIAFTIVVLLWISAFVGPIAMENPRGLSAAIDIALRAVVSGYLLMACAVQAIRGWAVHTGVSGYRHSILIALGALVPPFLVVSLI